MGCGVICFNESTFVTDDLAQCLCCVFLAKQCAFGANLNVDTVGRPSNQGFSDVPVHFLSRRLERRASLERRNRSDSLALTDDH